VVAGVLALAALPLVLALSGCGGGSATASSEGAQTDTTGTVEPGPGAFVSLGSVPELGLVLVDSRGFTLYASAEETDRRPACYAACNRIWLPLLTAGAPQPSNGTAAAKLGTVRRRDGKTQVTYAGHPLYSFVPDRGPGEARGNGFLSYGKRWHALEGSGEYARG
jgi:predicted lipoprotein with Yx(FWY)xxD motif